MPSSISVLKKMLQTGVAGMALLLCFTAHAGGWALTDQHGKQFTQFDSQGKWVLVNFWAPWCPSCLQEMPDLVSLQQRHRSLQIIGVAIMYRSRKDVDKIKDKVHLNYPVVMGNEDIASNFGSIRGLPTSYLYAPDGKLIRKIEGTVPIANIESQLVSKKIIVAQ